MNATIMKQYICTHNKSNAD